jgi:hypothetical protein
MQRLHEFSLFLRNLVPSDAVAYRFVTCSKEFLYDRRVPFTQENNILLSHRLKIKMISSAAVLQKQHILIFRFCWLVSFSKRYTCAVYATLLLWPPVNTVRATQTIRTEGNSLANLA